jgi:NodT family efflux transporter outer membrane factor (OMF) lipoprotein
MRVSGPASIRVLAFAAALLSSSCLKVGPDFHEPASVLPAEWSSPLAPQVRDGAEPSPAWWAEFRDPMLDALVARAVSGNREVVRAVAQVRAARAARRGAAAAYFPTVDTSAGYQLRQPSSTTASPNTSPSEPSRDRQFDDFFVGFDSAWELDLFGGIRRSNEQAARELEAAGADLDAVLVSVLAELARNYVEVRSLQARIAIAENNARSQSETLDLTRWRYQAGLVGALDVEQATYNLAQTRARIPDLETVLRAAANRVAVLLGEPAGALDSELAAGSPVPSPPPRVEVGLPTDLLRRRPDVVAAERRLAAATAAIGVAKADLYPKLSLSGSFEIAATDIAKLDTAAARGFSVGPTLRWNLFAGGALRAIVAQRSAEADVALAAWENSVLTAYEEAQNALVAFAEEQRRLARLAEARAAARQAQELARMQYESGVIDFQRVLEAERATLTFEESYAISQAAVTSNVVALYKALGGGWEIVDCGERDCGAAGASAAADGEKPGIARTGEVSPPP